MRKFHFTPFEMPPEAKALRQEVRAFLKEEMPQTASATKARSWSGGDAEFSRKLGARGWLGMTLPKKYGGHERSYAERYVVIEEMLVAGAPVGLHWVADRQSGPLIARFGMGRLLFGAGIIMAGANLMFATVAATGHSVAMLTLAVGTENLFAAISLTVFATYLSGLSSTAFTATQYALLSSVAAVGRTFATTPSGYAAAAFGWVGFYIFAACLAIPGLFFLWLMHRAGFVVETVRQTGVEEPETPAARD